MTNSNPQPFGRRFITYPVFACTGLYAVLHPHPHTVEEAPSMSPATEARTPISNTAAAITHYSPSRI